MRPFPARWLLAPALALAAAVPGPAMFRPGREWCKVFARFQPMEVACLPGGHLFTLEPNGWCDACAAGRNLSCAHPDRTTLVHLGRTQKDPDDQPDWHIGVVMTSLPSAYTVLRAGPGNTLVLGGLDAPYVRVRLAREGSGWRAAGHEVLLDAAQRRDLGLPPPGPETFALTSDGSLVLGLAGGVVLVPASGGGAAGQALKWLVPLPARTGGAGRSPGAAEPLVVAVDSAGQVAVLDTAARELFQINPATLKRTWIARAHQWPARFVPDGVVARGRQLVASGVFGGPMAPAGLVALAPAKGAGSQAATALGVSLPEGCPFTFAPEGYLAMFLPDFGILRIIEPAPEVDPEAKSLAEAKAQAAYEELLAEVEAETATAATRKAKAGRKPGRAGGAAEPTAASAPDPMPSLDAPDEELSLAQLCRGLGLALPPGGTGAGKPASTGWIGAGASPMSPRPRAAGGPGTPPSATERPAAAASADLFPRMTRAGAGSGAAPGGGLPRWAGPRRPQAAPPRSGPPVQAPAPPPAGRSPATASAGSAGSRPPETRAPAPWAGASRATPPAAGPTTASAPSPGETKAPAPRTGEAKELDERPRWRPVPIPLAEAVAEARAGIGPDGTGPAGPSFVPAPVWAHVAVSKATYAFARSTGFDDWAETWVRWLEARTPGDRPTALAALADLREDRTARPGLQPVGLGRFALPPAAIARVVEWMFHHAGLANNAPDLAAWRRAGGRDRPRFTLGLFYEPARERFLLELDDVNRHAQAIDDELGGPPVVTEALARSGGLTGLQGGPDGRLHPAYGLAVVLGGGPCHLGGIRPAGRCQRPSPGQPAKAPAQEPAMGAGGQARGTT